MTADIVNTSIPSGARTKIVFVNRYFHPDLSATSQMLSDLGFGLAQRGFSIHVVCSRQLYDAARADLATCEAIDGVTVHRVRTTLFGRNRLPGRALDYLSFYISSAWTLLALLNRGDTVVAMTDPPLISIVVMAVAKIKRARLVNWLQDVFPEVASRLAFGSIPPLAEALLRRLRNWSLHGAEANIVLGGKMRELLERIAIPAAQICIIENWAGVDDAPPAGPTQSQLRVRLHLEEKFVVGYSGNLGRAHEFQTLLEAAALLSADEDIVFLMIGGGAGMNALKQSVQLRAMHNFLFLPYQARAVLPDSMAAADVHWLSLLPTLEGLIVPSKVYGILAAARPMIFIGDHDGEVARLIGPAQAGVVVSRGDAAELARQIERLKSDPACRNGMGRNGYELYQKKFTLRRALARWVDVLAEREPFHALKPRDPVAGA
jgi:colanic acid biosynthesis glycosyl transferase WcaI